MTAADDRIRHVKAHAASEFNKEMNEECIQGLLTGTGSRGGCLAGLERYANVMAIYSWFVEDDIDETRNWFFTMARLQLARIVGVPVSEQRHLFSFFSGSNVVFSNSPSTMLEVGKVLGSLYSHPDNVPLIRVLSEQAAFILEGNIEKARDALNRSIDRASLDDSKYAADLSVFINLHHGDDEALHSSIIKLCDLGDERLELESGFTKSLMNTPATVYAKLCLMAGRHIDVRHSMIPAAWLMNDPEVKPVFNFPQLNGVVFTKS
ncbi:hypothetical protein L2Y94_10260 [Luteibacter aegosomatis]|uniref:hypothetical protein n=1 Tax=Luteibacter aegosomatis TaxID=2911537 RepID=UPI001FF94D84|nr:hypothetical protein [Luteibacter aegosomatis]UPG87712.1 hypothetical protein L2Y94_10260 [Luteibacter aegosomatis]